MRQAGEPSVEDILASIKKVIARDGSGDMAAYAEPRRPQPPAPEPDAPNDVLELSAEAQWIGSSEATARDAGGEAPLVGEAVRDSMRDSLAALAMLSEPGVPPQIVRSGETSLEGLTRELLKPALAEWLEANLPPLVERMVAAEIARIVGKRD
ncbi:DUF2497 domain-containing protein [Novosphingobium colocasiae]|uniref:DUF2497 domain-containing protein n=1 Tax=Novosphingobium colocasiae TaxID=1256513 RepID=UPI0035AEA0D3